MLGVSLDLTREVRVLVGGVLAGHRPVDTLQVFEISELDRDTPLLRRHLNTHARVEVFGQQVLEFE